MGCVCLYTHIHTYYICIYTERERREEYPSSNRCTQPHLVLEPGTSNPKGSVRLIMIAARLQAASIQKGEREKWILRYRYTHTDANYIYMDLTPHYDSPTLSWMLKPNTSNMLGSAKAANVKPEESDKRGVFVASTLECPGRRAQEHRTGTHPL